MKRRATAQDVWDDIQFELLQGIPSRDELGQSIRDVQRHQNELRDSVLGSGGRLPNPREVVSRQFQVNDMLLTLLQETATALRTVQLELQRTSRAAQGTRRRGASERAALPADDHADPERPETIDVVYSRPPAEIEMAMRPEALDVDRHERPSGLPVVGGLVTRVKRALHGLAHFYMAALASRQARVNRIYGDWIMDQIRINEELRDQVERLARRLADTGPADTTRPHTAQDGR